MQSKQKTGESNKALTSGEISNLVEEIQKKDPETIKCEIVPN